MMPNPFKFLDAYTLEDKTYFFGRKDEVSALHEMVLQNRLILIYGQSGTGKTSLVQCGLASKFDITDWYPIFLRPYDINTTLASRLRIQKTNNPEWTVKDSIEELYVISLRTVYLIFDQLEELFILGTREQQEEFASVIRQILQSGTPCRILLIIREEYLAHLYPIEKTLPQLFDRRLRVEPMSRHSIESVISGSCEAFDISVPEPPKAFINNIIDNLSSDKTGIQLPYLQVYLYTLYDTAVNRQFPNGISDNGARPHINLDPVDLLATGKLDDVLADYLEKQKEKIKNDLENTFLDSNPDSINLILDLLVTEQGTKRPVSYTRDDYGTFIVSEQWRSFIKPIHPAHIDFCLDAFEKSRLIRITDSHIELAHDALAHLIDGQRTSDQRRMYEMIQRLIAQFKDYKESGEMLTRKQLNIIEDYWPLLEEHLEQEVIDFVSQSHQDADRLEAEKIRFEHEKRKRAIRLAVFGFSLAAIAIAALIFATFQFKTTQKAQRMNVLKTAEALKLDGQYLNAIQVLEQLKNGDYGQPGRLEGMLLDTFQLKWQKVAIHMSQGDSLFELKHFRDAKLAFQRALELDPDTRISEKIEFTSNELEQTFQRLLMIGETNCHARKYKEAYDAFEKALKLKPNDPKVRIKQQNCR